MHCWQSRLHSFASLKLILPLSLILAALPGCSGGIDHSKHTHSESSGEPHEDGDEHEAEHEHIERQDLSELDHYVWETDPAYSSSLRSTVQGTDYTSYFLDMTSQSWRTAAEVDRTIWKHDLIIVVPDKILPGPHILYITGGDNKGPAATAPSDAVLSLARMTRAVVIELRQVPNQPLVFSDQAGTPLAEDALIAFSWAQAMKTADPMWSARFPMVKSAVRAIDTAREFLYSPAGGSHTLESFVVMGAGQRGWTAWLTAAVDPRVVGVIPVVSDALKLNECMKQHVESYGFWAKGLSDYHHNGIAERLGSKELDTLLKHEDPYAFRDRLAIPKYIVNATNDSVFLPDGSQNYLADLPGEKLLRYVANADQSLNGSDWLEGVAAYVSTLRRGRDRPSFTWQFVGEDSIRVETKSTPAQVLLWQAQNTIARDFRMQTIGKAWTRTTLSDQGGGVYVGKVTRPPAGYTAFFIELAFPSDLSIPHKLSTQVRVIPDTRPFAGIDPKTAKLEGT